MIEIIGYKKECPNIGHWAKVLIITDSPEK